MAARSNARKAETYRCARRNALRNNPGGSLLPTWRFSKWGVYGKPGWEEATRYCNEDTIRQLRDDERRRVRMLSTPLPECEAMRAIRKAHGVGRPVP